jgi:hypothetical protein
MVVIAETNSGLHDAVDGWMRKHYSRVIGHDSQCSPFQNMENSAVICVDKYILNGALTLSIFPIERSPLHS